LKPKLVVSLFLAATICVALGAYLAVILVDSNNAGPVTPTVQGEGGNKSNPSQSGSMFEVMAYRCLFEVAKVLIGTDPKKWTTPG
jgi:hypothetical protein